MLIKDVDIKDKCHCRMHVNRWFNCILSLCHIAFVQMAISNSRYVLFQLLHAAFEHTGLISAITHFSYSMTGVMAANEEKKKTSIFWYLYVVTQVLVDLVSLSWVYLSPLVTTHTNSPPPEAWPYRKPQVGLQAWTSLPLEAQSGADQRAPNDINLGWQIPVFNVSQPMFTLTESCLYVSSKQYTIFRHISALWW